MVIIVKFFNMGKGFVKKHLQKNFEIVYNEEERGRKMSTKFVNTLKPAELYTHTHTHTHTHTDKSLLSPKQIGTICFAKIFKFCAVAFCFCVFSFDVFGYTITFSCGAGSGTPPASMSVARNGTFVFPESTCTPPAGKEFYAWQMTCPFTLTWPPGTGMAYQCWSDTTVTALYEDVTYTVTYACGDGSGDAPTTNISATYGSSFTPATNTCIPPSEKSFVGWLVSGTSDVKPAGTAFSWAYTESKTFTAQYSAVMIGLTWYDNGSTISGASSCTLGGTFVPPTPPARPGYRFTGWKVKEIHAPTDCGIPDLNTSTDGTTHAYATLNNRESGIGESTYGLTQGSGQWATQFSYGTVYGMANCNTTSGTYAVAAEIRTESSGLYCWCQATGFTPTSNDYTGGPQCTVFPVSSSWVFVEDFDTSSNCAIACPDRCGRYVRYYDDFRSPLFGAVGQ